MAQQGYTFTNSPQPVVYHYTANGLQQNPDAPRVFQPQQPQHVIIQRPGTQQSTGRTLGILALLISCVSLVLCIIGTAIPFWIYASVNGASQSEGLWQICATSGYDGSVCASFPEGYVRDWVKAVRALEILGILVIGAACGCGFLKLFAAKDQNSLPKLAASSGILAGIFMLLGAIVYAAKFLDEVPDGTRYHLFAGFGLCLVAGILAIVAGIMYALAYTKRQI